jgi:hypothetical protein
MVMVAGGMKFSPIWQRKPEEFAKEFENAGAIGIMPVGAVTSGTLQFLKYIAVGGIGALAATYALKPGQEQSQKQKQAAAAASGGYTIFAYPDSQVSITEPTTGTAAISQTAEAGQAQLGGGNLIQMLVIGGLALGALWIFLRRKK